MIRVTLFLCLLGISSSLLAQDMDNKKLQKILKKVSSNNMEGQPGQWRLEIGGLPFICLTDETHNRMRIISPVAEVANVSNEQIMACMEANFHTALDVKYAISEGYLWSVFIHPLKELSEEQVIDAVSQVYSATTTFGTTYSSGSLAFPGGR